MSNGVNANILKSNEGCRILDIDCHRAANRRNGERSSGEGEGVYAGNAGHVDNLDDRTSALGAAHNFIGLARPLVKYNAPVIRPTAVQVCVHPALGRVGRRILREPTAVHESTESWKCVNNAWRATI